MSHKSSVEHPALGLATSFAEGGVPTWTPEAIEKVKKENERLKEQVEAETRSRSDNTAVHSHTLRLAEQVESYKSKIELEQRRLEELDRQHKIMQVSHWLMH